MSDEIAAGMTSEEQHYTAIQEHDRWLEESMQESQGRQLGWLARHAQYGAGIGLDNRLLPARLRPKHTLCMVLFRLCLRLPKLMMFFDSLGGRRTRQPQEVAARSLREGDKIRLHGTEYEVQEIERALRLTLRQRGSTINRTIEHVGKWESIHLAESAPRASDGASSDSWARTVAGTQPVEKPWLLLRPDCFLSGEHVWAVVRMPDETVYGHLNPHDDNPDTIGRPRVSEIEAKALRVAWDEVRNCEMDITLPYRIDGDEIGPP